MCVRRLNYTLELKKGNRYILYYLFLILECETEEPRDVSPRKVTQVKKKKTAEEEISEKSQSLCLRLNNNDIKDVNNLMTIATSLFESPSNIGWIDLSFNSLVHIDPVSIMCDVLSSVFNTRTKI